MLEGKTNIEISSRDYWFKVVECLQQNWALIDSISDGYCTVFFFGDTSGVFDSLWFPSEDEAKEALKRNGFERLANNKEAQDFFSVPKSPFEEVQHPNGPIYSSGRFWM